MKQMQERLQNVFADTNATTPANYNSVETIVINENDGTRTVTESEPKAKNNTYYNYKYYTTPYAGKYYFWQRDDMENYQFMCLYGDSSKNKKTVNKYTITAADMEEFYISDGSLYLSASANGVTATDKSGALKWSFDESGHLFAYINNDVYYLNRNGLSGIAVSQSASTVWSRNDQSALYTNISGIDYFLYYSAGWRLSSLTQYYYISDNNGHFISAQPKGTGGLTVINTDSADSSVKWQIDISGNEYTFFTDVSDTNYYLALDTKGALVMSTAKSSWILEDGYFTKTVSSDSLSTKYRLVYDGGWKVSEIGKLITDGNGHFLSCSTTSVTNSTQENAAVWQTTVGANGNTQFYTFINSVPYYLSYNEPDKLITVSQVPAGWIKEEDSYLTSDGKNHIGFENGTWKILPHIYQIISDGNGNYLKADGNNSFSNVTAESDATHFYFLNGNSGTVTYYYNGTKYYLGNDNESFKNTDTNWTKTTEGYLRSGSTDYYLVYDDGWKISDCGLYYTISYGSNYLNINSNGDGVTNGSITNATWWKFSNSGSDNPSGTIMAKGTKDKYLTFSYDYKLGVSSDKKEWTNDSKKLYSKNIF